MNEKLHAACYKIIKSLIQVVYRYGGSCGELVQLTKRAYIDVVEEALLNNGEKATTSRMAIISGLTRKDVAVLRKQPVGKPIDAVKYNRGVLVIDGWWHDDEFKDKSGNPRILPVKGDKSFETLVARYSGDMPYRSMLNELVRVGVVDLDNDEVRLLEQAYLSHDDDVGMDILGTDVSLLLGTIRHNLFAQDEDSSEAYYQRKVSYDNLPEEVLPEFRQLAQQENQKLLITLNEWLKKRDLDSNDPTGFEFSKRMKAGVSIYYFQEAVNEADNRSED